MRKRLTRSERKRKILNVLRDSGASVNKPLSCREITRRMGLGSGYSYVNSVLIEMCDEGAIQVIVSKSNKAISDVEFRYYV